MDSFPLQFYFLQRYYFYFHYTGLLPCAFINAPAYAVSNEFAYCQATKSIHDYFFLKVLDQVREGVYGISGCDCNRLSSLEVFEVSVIFILKVADYQS